MFIDKLTHAALFLLSVTIVPACASSDENEAPDSAEDDLARRSHFDISAPRVEWQRGCGIVRPGSAPCPSGLFLTYTKRYEDLTFESSIRVDNTNQKITITTDTWSTQKVHALMLSGPKTISLPQEGLQMGTTYTVVVKNFYGATLRTQQVTPSRAF